MKVVFRTDASLQIGTGHVMRCLALAQALRTRGAECEFICREHKGHLLDLLSAQGFVTHRLAASVSGSPSSDVVTHAAWLGVDWETDARECSHVLDASDSPDWLVVDHYALDARWELAVKPANSRLLVIDDLADRKHACNVLIDQNLGSHVQSYVGLVPTECCVLAGPLYAMLRPEFAVFRDKNLIKRRAPALQNILVTMGGVDAPNATGKALSVLGKALLPSGCRITVVMGASAPWLDAVKKQAEEMPIKTEVLVGISDMAERMADADLAIGAAGSTSWERCCLGLPSFLVQLADNQRTVLGLLNAAGAAVASDMNDFEAHLLLFLDSGLIEKRLAVMAECAASITDGRGMARLMSKMLGEAHG